MNDEMEKAERLFQQLSGNETTKNENLDHLKVCFLGSEKYNDHLLNYLVKLDYRVSNGSNLAGDSEDYFYSVDLNTFRITYHMNKPEGYKLLDIEDYLDEEESCEDNCAACGEPINSGNQIMYYNDGDMCCESCYDEDLDMEEEDEEDLFEHPTPRVSDLERAENTFRLLSETQSAPKDVIESKISELNNITRRRRR
jgi:hypothetical protein